jgi:hypothetical protein
MPHFAKFDPHAFLERKKRASEHADVQQTPEDATPPASKTLATLATLAASASQNEKLDFVRSSAAHHRHGEKSRKAGSTPAKVAKVAKVEPSVVASEEAPWGDAEEERAAIAEYDGGAPRVWAEALARLDPACPPPCEIPPTRWLRFIDDCGRFLDDGWAARAEALGWGPLELFGCDRIKPFARLDRAGLLWLIDGRKLLALTADTAAIATHSGGKLTYYRRQLETGRVLAWELGCNNLKVEGLCRTSLARG